MKMRTLAATLAASALLAAPALALVQHEDVAERGLEVASGAPARGHRAVTANPPSRLAKKRWDELAAVFGTTGTVWDEDTGVPLRLWGAGVAAPGAVADAATAERAARQLVADHLALLAPGAAPSDFPVLINRLVGDTRTVVLQQTWQGLPVLGGRIQVEIKRDRIFVIGSEALPDVAPRDHGGRVDPAVAAKAAADWIGAAYKTSATAGAVTGPMVLPVVREAAGGRPSSLDFRVVHAVDVATTEPLGRWEVYTDAATGQPLARRQVLRFTTGTVLFHVPATYPGAGYHDRAAPYLTSQVNGAAATADGAGLVTWAAAGAASITPGVIGTYVKVTSASGVAASGMLSVPAGGSAVWDQSATETADAELDAYINASDAKAYALAHIDANLAWLKAQIPVSVNETMHCNAYSNGDDIHFFTAGPSSGANPVNCNNTGRIADVLYHEFGHSLNANSYMGNWTTIDGSFSEGQADVYAQTMTNSSALGKGFFTDMPDTPIRESNPAGSEFVYPKDVDPQDPHAGGRILSGAMWDLRVALIAKYGQTDGVAKHDAMYYGIIQHAPDMPSSYAEALAANDNDGNLANGTPDQCLIQTAFAAHGLATGAEVTGIALPTHDGLTISVPVVAGNPDCPPAAIDNIKVTWQVRGNTATNGVVQLTQGAQAWSGAIPTQPDGTVVEYKVDVTYASGTTATYPDNVADPMYQLYVGPVTAIKCWDFEQQPTDWTHSAKVGLDEWQWGPPKNTNTNGDPPAAHGGSNVFGIDLMQAGGDGLYARNTDELATTPVVDTTGFKNVRLQYYRWLGVEDHHFDHATISVDGNERWANFDSNMGDNSATEHVDREWRFHDVDLAADAADNKVQITFELTSDPGLEFGGWTLDDVCIVGTPLVANAVCGNGVVEAGEQCDDGNTTSGDGCSSTCQTETAPGTPPTGCCSTTHSGAAGDGLLALGLGALLVRRRRARAPRA